MSPIRINLLPHRQQKRVQQQRLFVALIAGTAAAAALIVLGGHMVIADSKDIQTRRNDLLRQEISALDVQIQENRQLKEKTQALLDRKKVVESLQGNRTEAVHMFDELVRRIPEGLYLKGLKQVGDQLTIQGYAQSNARVSTFMRNLENSPWFESARLVEARGVELEKLRVSEFTLTVNQSKAGTSVASDKQEGG